MIWCWRLKDEAELAGVMAHEMAHVALRHGTNQASKAYLAQAGLGVLGGLLGNSGTSQIIGAVGGFGLNTLFLKFSRDDEREADEKGMLYLRRAGFDPRGMPELMRLLQAQQRRDPGSVELFFASHPSPADRLARLDGQARQMAGGRRDSRAFRSAQARAADLGPMASLGRNR